MSALNVIHRAPPRRDTEELMDQPGQDPAVLVANLRDIRRVNSLFGGVRTVTRHLPALLAIAPTDRPATVLDLATGSGDIPRAILDWATKRQREVHVTASDASDDILTVAAEHLADQPNITLTKYDARAVPLPDKHFDIVLCSLALHHFSPDEATSVLREMDRLATVGFIVNDLARSRLGYAGAWLASRLTRNPLTRHDAPLSALRAYTPAELRSLLARAGITDAVVTTHPWFRMAAVKVVDHAAT